MTGSAGGCSPRLGREWLIALAIAVTLCAVRLVIFDFGAFFQLESLPNHDTYSGAAAFASSMHSIALGGDIAWWLPDRHGGYAQYYNFFLSPLAPTAGNVFLILWTAVYKLLTGFGIRFPEYYQFLAYNYAVMPVAAYATLAVLCRRFCRGWTGPVVATVAYAFSGTGLWNGAWMFYQEWPNVFLLLWALDLFCRRPGWPALAWLAAACVLMASSFSYWTVFSSWFLAVWIGGHLYFFRRSWAVALAWLRARLGDPVMLATLLATGATSALWAVTIGLVYLEQSGTLIRGTVDGGSGFPMAEAYERGLVSGLRHHVTSLFEPALDRAVDQGVNIAIHNAHYVGIALLPLLIAFFTTRWRGRYGHILFVSLLVQAAVSMGSGTMLLLWATTPGMSLIRHAFYFNTYFTQILLILIAALTLDRALRAWPAGTEALARALKICAALAAAAILFVFVQNDTLKDQALTLRSHSLLLAAVLLLLGCGVLWHVLHARGRDTRHLYAALFVFLLAGDLTRYYWQGSIADQEFTSGFRDTAAPLPEDVRQALAATWNAPGEGARSFGGDLAENMPPRAAAWPTNRFNPSVYDREFRDVVREKGKDLHVRGLAALAAVPPGDTVPEHVSSNPRLVRARISEWGYNRVALDVDLRQQGLLLFSIAYDPAWRVELDGQAIETHRANVRHLAIRAGSGEHEVVLTYWPTSRSVYIVARVALGLCLLVLLAVGVRGARRTGRAARRREAVPPSP